MCVYLNSGAQRAHFGWTRYVGGKEGIGHPDISGIFIDDSWSAAGPSEIDPHANNDTGLSPADVQDMIIAWSGNMVAVQEKVISAGAMNWQLFANGGTLAVRLCGFVCGRAKDKI